MNQDTNITDVLFLIEKPEGELTCNVFAFMPKELHNNSNPKLFTSYVEALAKKRTWNTNVQPLHNAS